MAASSSQTPLMPSTVAAHGGAAAAGSDASEGSYHGSSSACCQKAASKWAPRARRLLGMCTNVQKSTCGTGQVLIGSSASMMRLADRRHA